MNISKNKVVSLSYELRHNDKDGKVIQTVGEGSPLEFIFGTNSLLPVFERNVENMKAGDKYAFHLPCEDAYGAKIEDAVVEIPKTAFVVDDKIDDTVVYEGNTLSMTDTEGNRMNGVIVKIKDETIVMDFNHPLAGVNLYFSGTIVSVREATPEELKNGLNSSCSPDSCGGCSGGCS